MARMYQKGQRTQRSGDGAGRSKGERRREELLRATLRVIGAHGADAVTHRAVAEEAGVPLSATTYYFASKEELLEQALLLAAREETGRLERLVLELAPQSLSVEEWAAAVAHLLAGDVAAEPARHVALFELGLEATRREPLRAELQRWQDAHLRLAEMGCRAIGSDDPELDARVVVATLTGLMLQQLAGGREDFEDAVMRPALERLLSRISTRAPAGAPA
ncbi:MAG TPA: TetR family transcriptional regulator [Thermoleophilaceae bacterium]|nr:TetR family transcriptional regulator [Thermoleophilaceae bacterium]